MKRVFSNVFISVKGITLIEVLVTLVVLSIIVTPFVAVTLISARSNNSAEEVLHAVYLAQNNMESIHTMDYNHALDKNGERRFLENGFEIETIIEPFGSIRGYITAQTSVYKDGNLKAQMESIIYLKNKGV